MPPSSSPLSLLARAATATYLPPPSSVLHGEADELPLLLMSPRDATSPSSRVQAHNGGRWHDTDRGKVAVEGRGGPSACKHLDGEFALGTGNLASSSVSPADPHASSYPGARTPTMPTLHGCSMPTQPVLREEVDELPPLPMTPPLPSPPVGARARGRTTATDGGMRPHEVTAAEGGRSWAAWLHLRRGGGQELGSVAPPPMR